MTTFQLHKKVI